MNYKVKAKGSDGRYFTHGNVQDGKYGPRMGLKLTPELRQMIEAKNDGEWVNFDLFENDGGQRQPAPPQASESFVEPDETPF